MTYKESLQLENERIRNNLRNVNHHLIEIREYLSELTQEELNSKNVQEIYRHRLEIVKGMSNRELDLHIFEVFQTCEFLSDHLDNLFSEKEKRVKIGFMPVDGSDWEAAANGCPSIGPRIDAIESMEEEGIGYA